MKVYRVVRIWCRGLYDFPFPPHTDKMLIRFADEEGTIYEWMPRWDDLCGLFQDAYHAEKANKGPHSPELKKFVDTAKWILQLDSKKDDEQHYPLEAPGKPRAD